MHPLLHRQLRKLGFAEGAGATAHELEALLQAISRSYGDVDQERYLLERSQDLASGEMAELNGALRLSEARMASLLSLSSDWVWEQSPSGCFTFVSDELRQLTGIEPGALVGHACSVDGPLRVDPADMAAMSECVAERATFHHITVEVACDDVDSRYMRISGAPVFEDERYAGYRGVGSDVTERVLAERKILELARFDTLTGLPNRSMFIDEAHRAIARARRAGREVALLFIDLDRFKQVNDTLGHAAGDVVLQTVASRFNGLVRDADLLARLGGDEFVVIAEVNGVADDMASVAQRIIEAAIEPIVYESSTIEIAASVGLAVFPRDGDDAHSLLRAADTAMYEAKAKGKCTFEFFTEELATRASRHFHLEQELRAAVDEQQWVLHWQPQIDTGTGRWVGVEGLIRWQHPTRGLLAPSEFIDLAEDTGHIVPMGRWVIEAACEQFERWRRAGVELQHCSVNLSVRQLDEPAMVAEIITALAANGMSPRQLELEVTESSIMTDPARALATLDRLHDLGVQLAVDDFGTGYSSLGQLKRIPAQTLKIDRIFVGGLPDCADDLAITRAVVAMGQSLGMRIVAEGVETEAQRACLERLGVDQLQGFLISRPLPAVELTPVLLGRSAESYPANA